MWVMTRREFRRSETKPQHSRAAAVRRILQERRRDKSFQPRVLPPRPLSPALGSGQSLLSGEARIARLAQPRTQLWEICAQPADPSSNDVRRTKSEVGMHADLGMLLQRGRPRQQASTVACKDVSPVQMLLCAQPSTFVDALPS